VDGPPGSGPDHKESAKGRCFAMTSILRMPGTRCQWITVRLPSSDGSPQREVRFRRERRRGRTSHCAQGKTDLDLSREVHLRFHWVAARPSYTVGRILDIDSGDRIAYAPSKGDLRPGMWQRRN